MVAAPRVSPPASETEGGGFIGMPARPGVFPLATQRRRGRDGRGDHGGPWSWPEWMRRMWPFSFRRCPRGRGPARLPRAGGGRGVSRGSHPARAVSGSRCRSRPDRPRRGSLRATNGASCLSGVAQGEPEETCHEAQRLGSPGEQPYDPGYPPRAATAGDRDLPMAVVPLAGRPNLSRETGGRPHARQPPRGMVAQRTETADATTLDNLYRVGNAGIIHQLGACRRQPRLMVQGVGCGFDWWISLKRSPTWWRALR